MDPIVLFATAPRGMTDLLAAELIEFGAANVREARGGVRFESNLAVAYRTCLWSRIANRILMPLGNFAAASTESLYEGVRRIDWRTHLSPAETLAVDANIAGGAISHSHYAALRVKDAIVDHFLATTGERPSVDTARPDIRINCYVHGDAASVYLDLSGASLHQRNYRIGAGQAPLKENLAAAILLRAGWPEIARERGAFMDLMCGAGTLAIEAAMMAGDIAPGLTRQHFGFTRWLRHDAAVWASLLNEARGRREAGLRRMPVILAFDNNRRVLPIARENAQRAGLSGKISFEFQDVRDFRHSVPARGLTVTNPPYGKRLADSGELPALYAAIGNVLKRHMQDWKAAIFTEDQSLGKHIGIRAERIHSFYNGAIACKLIHFNVVDANFFKKRRLPHRVRENELSEQAGMFKNRLQKNLRQMERRAERTGTSCYRVYDADLPDFAAAIDVYHSAGAADETWICIQEYKAPASIEATKARLRTRELVTVTRSVFSMDDDHLFYKTRTRQRGGQQYSRLDHLGHFYEVREGDCKLLVNFEDYLDTGLFLDHRPMRARLRADAAGKSFLNLFSYTGTATVHAAIGGAASTTSVDTSRTYHDWARRNLELNGLGGKQHRFIRADCLDWLDAEDARQYDLIFLDPPTFSNSKRTATTLDVRRDHANLIRLTMRKLNPDGALYFSTNARHFNLDAELDRQFAVREITAETIPFDFKRRPGIHRCFLFRHLTAGS